MYNGHPSFTLEKTRRVDVIIYPAIYITDVLSSSLIAYEHNYNPGRETTYRMCSFRNGRDSGRRIIHGTCSDRCIVSNDGGSCDCRMSLGDWTVSSDVHSLRRGRSRFGCFAALRDHWPVLRCRGEVFHGGGGYNRSSVMNGKMQMSGVQDIVLSTKAPGIPAPCVDS